MEFYFKYIVGAVLLFIIAGLYLEFFTAPIIFLIGVAILAVFGIITPQEALAGFANEQIAVIVLLLIIGNIIQRTSIVNSLFNVGFKNVKTYKGFLTRMIVYIAPISAFTNNTPLVAMMMPYVHNWSKKNKVAPSKLLIPLSFAAILGGCVTLIGTSTNLISDAIARENGLPGFQMFDFAVVGIIMMLVGGLFLVLFSGLLLPKREDVLDQFKGNVRKFLVETKVNDNSKLIGKTVLEGGLRNLSEIFLVEIVRGENVIAPVSPDMEIQKEDYLNFAGEIQNISEILDGDFGLYLPEAPSFITDDDTEVVETVVSYNSTLIDKEVKKADFRGNYDAAIIAIHRNGEKVTGKIGEVVLKAGDVLLLISGSDFYKRIEDKNDFYYLNKVETPKNIEVGKALLMIGGLIAVIVMAATGVFPLFKGLLGIFTLMIVTRVTSVSEIRKSIDYNLIVIIALALSLGKAMLTTGTADSISHVILSVLEPYGIVGVLTGLFILTSLIGGYMTNKAAVSILIPIAISVAAGLNVSPIPVVMVVAFAGAASFLTPIGYQTNMMVYGPGGYKFKDYLKIGIPLTVLYLIVTVLVVIKMYDL
jgi:di/tricarboxylate transporter